MVDGVAVEPVGEGDELTLLDFFIAPVLFVGFCFTLPGNFPFSSFFFVSARSDVDSTGSGGCGSGNIPLLNSCSPIVSVQYGNSAAIAKHSNTLVQLGSLLKMTEE